VPKEPPPVPPTELHLFYNSTYLVIAYTTEDAMHILEVDAIGEPIDPHESFFDVIDPDTLITLKTVGEGGPIAPVEDTGADIKLTTLTAAQWIAREGRGFLSITEG
jgi:hypothetical protein